MVNTKPLPQASLPNWIYQSSICQGKKEEQEQTPSAGEPMWFTEAVSFSLPQVQELWLQEQNSFGFKLVSEAETSETAADWTEDL